MTSEGHPDHRPPGTDDAQHRPSPPVSGPRHEVVSPAPSRVRATASVPGILGRPDGGDQASPSPSVGGAPSQRSAGPMTADAQDGQAATAPTGAANLFGPYPPPPATPPSPPPPATPPAPPAAPQASSTSAADRPPAGVSEPAAAASPSPPPESGGSPPPAAAFPTPTPAFPSPTPGPVFPAPTQSPPPPDGPPSAPSPPPGGTSSAPGSLFEPRNKPRQPAATSWSDPGASGSAEPVSGPWSDPPAAPAPSAPPGATPSATAPPAATPPEPRSADLFTPRRPVPPPDPAGQPSGGPEPPGPGSGSQGQAPAPQVPSERPGAEGAPAPQVRTERQVRASTGAVTGRAAVPAANRIERREGDPLPPAPAPRTYGTPISPHEVDSPLPTRTPRQRPIGAAVYSDLLSPVPPATPSGSGGPSGPGPSSGPATPEASSTPEPPAGPAAPGALPPESAPAGPWAPPAQVGSPAHEAGTASELSPTAAAAAGSPTSVPPVSPADPSHPADARATPGVAQDVPPTVGGSPAGVPSWPPPAPTATTSPPTQPAPSQPGQPQGWSSMWAPATSTEATAPSPGTARRGEAPPAEPAAGRTGLPWGVIAAALLGAALIVGLALSVPYLLERLGGDDTTYAVGKCVVRDGGIARPADCSEPDAFEIVLQVEAIEDCPRYPDQHAITVDATGDVFCLEPVRGETDEPPATATPSAEATP